MFEKKTIRDVNVRDEVVLVRADYNVPIEDGVIVDDLRIRESLPTLQYLLENGARKIVVMSHLGRPEGKVEVSLSLSPIATRLAELLPGTEVNFVPYTVGAEVESGVEAMSDGAILLLENLRFSPDEEANASKFAQEIVDCVQPSLFVQDGFGVVHRAHASTNAIAKLLPAVAGLLLEKEVVNLSKARQPESPSVCIIGGAKVEEKAPLIAKFAEVYDKVFVGGKIANTYTTELPNVILPIDFVRGEDGVAYDIGIKSATKIADTVKGTRTVLWNGVMGMAEDERYDTASRVVAEAVGHLRDGSSDGDGEFGEGSTTVIAGGDTTGFVENLQKSEPDLYYSLLSTGGGAALEFLIGEKLPGIEVLENK